MNFADRLISEIQRKQNPTCVGLDPRLDKVPPSIQRVVLQKHGKTFKAAAEAIYALNCGIIDAVADVTAVVKIQWAFYTIFGLDGVEAFIKTSNYAKKKGLIVIGDTKSNDIGSTATPYAQAYLGEVDVFGTKHKDYDLDALTISPYLGSDSIVPFAKECETYHRGIFVLVKTSNPSSKDIQDIEIPLEGAEHGSARTEKIYQRVGRLVVEIGKTMVGERGYSSVGAVVGATHPEEMKILRDLFPTLFFLVPGYGAQGAGIDDIRHAFDAHGNGAIINSSRGIMQAYESDPKYTPEDYKDAARAETIRMQTELKQMLGW